MNKHDFDYDLPADSIAQQPLARRSASRLLTLARDDGHLIDGAITDLPDRLAQGDLLVHPGAQRPPPRLEKERIEMHF